MLKKSSPEFLAFFLAAVALIGLLFSCRSKMSGWEGSIEEVDGVTIIRNPIQPLHGEEALRIEEDLANALGVNVSVLLEEKSRSEREAYSILQMTDEIMKAHPELDRENVRHTLLLLQEEPISRLRRALIRGRRFDIHK